MHRSVLTLTILFVNLAVGQLQNSSPSSSLRSSGDTHFILGISGIYALRTGVGVNVTNSISVEGALGYMPGFNVGGPDESLILSGIGLNLFIANRNDNSVVASLLLCKIIGRYSSRTYDGSVLTVAPTIGVDHKSESGSGFFVRFGPVASVSHSSIKKWHFTIDTGWFWSL